MYYNPVSIKDFSNLSEKELRAKIETLLERIDKIEPHILSLLPEPDRRKRLLSEFDQLLRRFPDPSSRPGLFGVPVGVKDIFRADHFETRAGSVLPPGLFSGPEAETVKRLKEAGALILGKTVTTEFAYFQPGPTRNPWNLQHTPGGSSSGSAAAVAAGFCPIALGSQTVGSTNRPAAYCGIVGFKPSFGRISLDGVIPFSPSADHVGVLAADIPSASAAAEVLFESWRPNISAADPAQIKILILEDSYSRQASEEALKALRATADLLSVRGITVKPVSLIDSVEDLNKIHQGMIAREFAETHREWFKDHGNLYSQISKDLITLGEKVKVEEFESAKAGRLLFRRRIDELLNSEKALAFLTPSAQAAAPAGLGKTGSPLLNLPWTYAGVPAVTLPSGLDSEGLPLGIQLVGVFGKDEELLAGSRILETLLGKLPRGN